MCRINCHYLNFRDKILRQLNICGVVYKKTHIYMASTKFSESDIKDKSLSKLFFTVWMNEKVTINMTIILN